MEHAYVDNRDIEDKIAGAIEAQRIAGALDARQRFNAATRQPVMAAMKKCSNSAHESLTELNITPLLDLAFVLLVIFIITTIPPVKDMDLKLPTASKHQKDPPRKANYISLQADGKLYLNQERSKLDDLLAHADQPAHRRPGLERHRARRRQDQVQTNPRRAGHLPAGQRRQGGPGHRSRQMKILNRHAPANPATQKEELVEGQPDHFVRLPRGAGRWRCFISPRAKDCWASKSRRSP